MKFEKITDVRLPFCVRNKDSKKDYGNGGLIIWFILKGPKGAVQYQCGFGITLPHAVGMHGQKVAEYSTGDVGCISGWDVGYHSPKPTYDGQSSMGSECKFIEGGKCYYDGSGLRAADWTKEIFSDHNRFPEDVIWEKLEQEYKDCFESDANAAVI